MVPESCSPWLLTNGTALVHCINKNENKCHQHLANNGDAIFSKTTTRLCFLRIESEFCLATTKVFMLLVHNTKNNSLPHRGIVRINEDIYKVLFYVADERSSFRTNDMHAVCRRLMFC